MVEREPDGPQDAEDEQLIEGAERRSTRFYACGRCGNQIPEDVRQCGRCGHITKKVGKRL